MRVPPWALLLAAVLAPLPELGAWSRAAPGGGGLIPARRGALAGPPLVPPCLGLRGGTTAGLNDKLAAQAILFSAATKGDADAVAEALEGGADPNAPCQKERGETALHLAASYGHMECVLELLSAGAVVDSRNRWGSTPLHVASEGGHAEVMQVLINAGADPNKEAMPTSVWTPIFFAAAHGHYDACKLLIDSGARLHLRDEQGHTPAEVAERWRQRPKDIRKTEMTEPPSDGGVRKRLVELLSRVSNTVPRSVYQQSGVEQFQAQYKEDIEGVRFPDPQEDTGEGGGEEGDVPGKLRIQISEKEIEGTFRELKLHNASEALVKAAGRCSSDTGLLEVLTHENETVCFEITDRGFQCVSRSVGSEHLGRYFETLQAGLMRISEEYSKRFLAGMGGDFESGVRAGLDPDARGRMQMNDPEDSDIDEPSDEDDPDDPHGLVAEHVL